MSNCVTRQNIWEKGQSHHAGGLREGKKDKYEMWFKSESRGKFVHVTYAVRDEAGDFQGVLEYVQDIQPYRGESIVNFIEDWSKNELRKEFMKGLLRPGSRPRS